MIQYINLVVNNLVHNSHNTIFFQVSPLFEESKNQIVVIFQVFFPFINITFDAWLLANHLTILGIVNRFTSENKSSWKLYIFISEKKKSHSEND